MVNKTAVQSYANTLGINYNTALEILQRNKLTSTYIKQPGLKMQSENTTLNVLLKATLFRSFNDFSKIRESEKLMIKNLYKINLNNRNI